MKSISWIFLKGMRSRLFYASATLAYTRESRKLRASGVEPDFSAYETDKMTAPPSRIIKEGVGFEPTGHLTMPNGFQDRPYKPSQATFQIIHRDIRHGFLCHLI